MLNTTFLGILYLKQTKLLTGLPGYQILWAPYYYMPQVWFFEIGSKIIVIKTSNVSVTTFQ